MPALVLKNVPEALHERLKVQAAANRRSLTQEVIQLLERGVLTLQPEDEQLPKPIQLKGGPVSTEWIEAAIAEGQR
jgi:plasmid stability protein